MVGSDGALHAATASDALTRTGHAAIEIHAVDTDGRIVLDAKIDVLRNTKAEVAGLREVLFAKFVLLDLEATLENLLGLCELVVSFVAISNIGRFIVFVIYLRSPNSDMNGDLFVTTDTKRTDSITGLA